MTYNKSELADNVNAVQSNAEYFQMYMTKC